MHREPSYCQSSEGVTTAFACPEQVPPFIESLPADLASWLQREHPQLAEALLEAQRAPRSAFEDEATVCIEGLPDATRRFLWQGLEATSARTGLTASRSRARGRTRSVFEARIHLFVSDLLATVLAATPPDASASSALSPHEPPKPP